MKTKEKKIKKIDKNKQRHQRKPKVLFCIYKYRHLRPLLAGFWCRIVDTLVGFWCQKSDTPHPH